MPVCLESQLRSIARSKNKKADRSPPIEFIRDQRLALFLALLDLFVNSFLRGLCFIIGQAEVAQRLANAVTVGQSRQNRVSSDCRISPSKVLPQPRRGHVVTKR